MIEQKIGEIAGDVWRFIERQGGQADLNVLRQNFRHNDGLSADLGTGWLAREGKVAFLNDNGGIRVQIRR